MTQYIKKSFDHAWQAAKFVEEGGKLFENCHSDSFGPVESHGEAFELFHSGIPLYTIKPKDWRDQLDGTVDNGVLCWVSDVSIERARESLCFHIIISPHDGRNGFVSHSFNSWDFAEPLTRAEIAKFMENAPE